MFFTRAGNSLIWFPSESLVFCQKMSSWAIHSKKWAIPHSRSFDLSEMSDEQMSDEQMSDEQMSELPALFFTT